MESFDFILYNYLHFFHWEISVSVVMMWSYFMFLAAIDYYWPHFAVFNIIIRCYKWQNYPVMPDNFTFFKWRVIYWNDSMQIIITSFLLFVDFTPILLIWNGQFLLFTLIILETEALLDSWADAGWLSMFETILLKPFSSFPCSPSRVCAWLVLSWLCWLTGRQRLKSWASWGEQRWPKPAGKLWCMFFHVETPESFWKCCK